jgi:protein-S-isoprenylcysteine O-methyltransferase Ste14
MHKLSSRIRSYRTVATGLAPVVLLAAVWHGKAAAASLVGIIAGTALVAAGSALRLWAAGHMAEKGEDLAVTGPYAHTRNPLYLGSLIAGLGFCPASGLWWSYPMVAFLFTLFYIPTIISEERYLARRHGKAYEDYAWQVPRLWWRAAPYARGGSFSFGNVVMHKEQLVAPQLFVLVALFWLRLFVAGSILGRG